MTLLFHSVMLSGCVSSQSCPAHYLLLHLHASPRAYCKSKTVTSRDTHLVPTCTKPTLYLPTSLLRCLCVHPAHPAVCMLIYFQIVAKAFRGLRNDVETNQHLDGVCTCHDLPDYLMIEIADGEHAPRTSVDNRSRS